MSMLALMLKIEQSIVTSYAGFLVDDMVAIVKNARHDDNVSVVLWRRVMQTLRAMMKHDQDGTSIVSSSGC